MPLNILITSTSFMDTPGIHQTTIAQYDLQLNYLRGPLDEATMLHHIEAYDALICGDDALTEQVLSKGKNAKLKFVSKYGVGLDKIDLSAAKKLGIPVTNCPGVNQVSVAEHFFAALLCYLRNIHLQFNEVQGKGLWTRMTGNEMYGKKLLIMGLGRIGSEIATRAKAFGLQVYGYDQHPPASLIEEGVIEMIDNLSTHFSQMDFVSLNLPLLPDTKHILSAGLIQQAKKELVVVNTARGELVDQDAMIQALQNKTIGGYVTDVLDIEPMPSDHPLRHLPNVLITPHIGSRTFDSVQRQGMMAVQNLVDGLNIPLKTSNNS